MDIDELIGPAEVAEVLGLSNVNGVSVYRTRHATFPAPIVERGRCLLWLRPDIDQWAAEHPGRRS